MQAFIVHRYGLMIMVDERSNDPRHVFNESYFHRDTYANVSFRKYSQYWWSNRYYARLARKYGPQQGNVLEIGCGLGHLLTWMTDRYRVFGTDINIHALKEARKNVPEAQFVLLSAEDLGALPEAYFQIVFSKHVVEHLPNPQRGIAEASRMLAPGGLLVLATPNLDSPMRALKGEGWIGYRDPTHISLKPPKEWLALLRNHNLQPKKIFADGFWDAPYLPWLPSSIQKILFGWPGGLQAILGWSIIPLQLGESLIVIAEKSD
jgi:2-polyprenyl-3-methyl-5-hydroxy-6-metoxy-1,4-benzoquinol methylase